jgi:hypothetical protein
MPTPTLRCRDCGHKWTSRSSNLKSPQCSKCRSRKVERFTDWAIVDNNTSESAGPAQSDGIEGSMKYYLIKDIKALLCHLKGDEAIDDATFYTTLPSICPFCGAASEGGMMYSGNMSKWVCLSCGVRAQITLRIVVLFYPFSLCQSF